MRWRRRRTSAAGWSRRLTVRRCAVFAAVNAAASPLRYEIDGAEQYRIQSEIEEQGWDLGAIYHSHTRSAP